MFKAFLNPYIWFIISVFNKRPLSQLHRPRHVMPYSFVDNTKVSKETQPLLGEHKVIIFIWKTGILYQTKKKGSRGGAVGWGISWSVASSIPE